MASKNLFLDSLADDYFNLTRGGVIAHEAAPLDRSSRVWVLSEVFRLLLEEEPAKGSSPG